MNLRDEIGLQVQSRKPATICSAQQEALEVETWHREKNRLRLASEMSKIQTRQVPAAVAKRFSPSTAQHSIGISARDPPNHSLPLAQRTGLLCNFCKKTGHTENQCYSKRNNSNFQKGQISKRPPHRVNYAIEADLGEEVRSEEDYSQSFYDLSNSEEIYDSS